MEHVLYTNADADAPASIKDIHGDVVLGLCKVCGRGEIQLQNPCTPPLTDENIARLKADNLKEFPHHAGAPGAQVYTCENCDDRRLCPFSMDPYNTNGDCLASK